MNTPKIFGREPAVLASLIEALLALLLSFNVLTFVGIDDQGELMIVMAVVNGGVGLYVALVTRDTLLAAAVAMTKSLIAFCAIYGLSVSLEQTGTLIAFLTVAIGLFQRTQTGPAKVPSLRTTSNPGTVSIVGADRVQIGVGGGGGGSARFVGDGE